MIGTIGDLVEDIVVRLATPLHEASDTAADVVRRRGGSAANMAVSVARAGHPARFIGQVGDDATGAALIDELRAEGVDVVVRRGGRTGTIVVILDHAGERSMLTDRGACTGLAEPQRAWLDGLSTLHVPVYSLVGEPLASSTMWLVAVAHQRGITVSIDASSASVIDDYGADDLLELLSVLRPTVLLCNEPEAEALGGADDLAGVGAGILVVKRGGRSAIVTVAGSDAVDVPAQPLDHVRDTTGAGDAFAAGLLVALAAGKSPVAATAMGHEAAARAIRLASGGV